MRKQENNKNKNTKIRNLKKSKKIKMLVEQSLQIQRKIVLCWKVSS